ncbi:MAG: glycine betaine ABC transporter substrate-binding protein, partial [Burkholderiales bacterium]
MRRALLAMLLLQWSVPAAAVQTLTVGSKRFTESYILGEIISQQAATANEARVVHKPGLGNTGILFKALQTGAIDIYPDYTGTIAQELLKNEGRTDMAALNRRLAPLGLGVAVMLGFNNSYALAMRETQAERLGIRNLSDLGRHHGLKLGLSQEFLQRRDGWVGLKEAYRLPYAAPKGLDHGLAYEAIAAQQIDIMDIYSTDAKIKKYRLRVLHDDRGYFPVYDAVLLYRVDLARRLPQSWACVQQLRGRISADAMVAMNAKAELEGVAFDKIAAAFLAGHLQRPIGATGQRHLGELLFGEDFWRLSAEHLMLVFVSVTLGVAFGVPLGVWAAWAPRAAPAILGTVGVIQTIPALALFAFLIPFLQRIGTLPALIALFLYSLLPIVR